MMKTLLIGFITLICVAIYASPNTQPNQNTNSSNTTNPTTTLSALPAAAAVQFAQPWARPTTTVANQVSSSAMYFTLVNTRGSNYKLVNISSDEIGSIEIHQTITGSSGVSQMVPVDLPFLIAGNINTSFAPGGLHIMLYDLKRPLNAEGRDSISINFYFDDGTSKEVKVQIANSNPYNTTSPGN